MNVILVEGVMKGYHECEFFSALEFSLFTGDLLLFYVVIGTLKKRRSTKPHLFIEIREGYWKNIVPYHGFQLTRLFDMQEMVSNHFQSSSSYCLKSVEEKQELNYGSLFTKGRI